MKLTLRTSIVCLASIGASAACAATSAPTPNLHDLMKNVVAVQAQVVWDVGNNAVDDQGNPDASKLTPADWARIASASTLVKQVATSLINANHVMAAAPGQKLDGEENPGSFNAKQVQAFLDADPQAFRAFSQALAVTMDQITSAVTTKNATKLSDASGELDQICESCHMKFWYPPQKPAG